LGALDPLVRNLGLSDYQTTWRAMRRFTDARAKTTADEIWLVEHPPVFTLGQAGKPEHLIAESDIPVLRIDRGGQITYHGPGQVVMYTLIDLRRRGLGVRQFVGLLEASVIALLDDLGVTAARREDAPGVYVGGAKIASLGLRIRGGSSYHGVALNVDLDLGPFKLINPCGFPDMPVTRLKDLGVTLPRQTIAAGLATAFTEMLGKNSSFRR